MAFNAAQSAALNGQAQESAARAGKMAAETQAIPQELEIDRMKAATTNLAVGTADDKEFERRLKISDQLLKERNIAVIEGNANKPERPTQQ